MVNENLDGFDWDEGNSFKNWEKHKVEAKESEEVFFNQPLLINIDKAHSVKEARLQVLGKTSKKRKLFLVFAIRNKKIRIISARSMSRKERRKYEKIEKNTKV